MRLLRRGSLCYIRFVIEKFREIKMPGIKIEFLQESQGLSDTSLASAFAKTLGGDVCGVGESTKIVGTAYAYTLTPAQIQTPADTTEDTVRKAARDLGYFIRQTGDASFEITNSFILARDWNTVYAPGHGKVRSARHLFGPSRR